jgi:hypothetical protein
MYLAMSPTDVLDHIIKLNPTAKTIVDVGAYYCGWSKYMADKLPEATVYALQTPNKKKLNHIIDTTEGELSEFDILGWKKHMKGMLEEKYHQYYDFNLYAKEIQSRKNLVGILAESPGWNTNFDICMISMTKDPNENLLQYKHWRQYGHKGSVMLLAAYNELPNDNFSGPLKNRKDLVKEIKKIDPHIIEYDHEHIILHNA